jgi:ATP-binding cassette subfamily B protein
MTTARGGRENGRQSMELIRTYSRVLGLLQPESRLAWALSLANLALAAAQFAEPVLFGRIIDALTGARTAGALPSWGDLLPLMAAWVGFGLFTIVCGTLVALYADRLAHRLRHAVLTRYFEHVLQLPIAFHSGTHSGRLMKVMLQGTDALWSLWVAFLREHFSAFFAVILLLPLSLFLNWRLALILIALAAIFTGITAFVVRKSSALQSAVEGHYSNLAERASDTLGNVALVQSYTRIEAEVSGLRNIVEKLLAAQIPVLSWWALVVVLTRTSTTISTLAIFLVGTWLHLQGLASIGDMVMFVQLSTLLIGRLEQLVGFVNRIFDDVPRLREFFEVLDSIPEVRDKPDAVDPGRLVGRVEFAGVSFSYDGKRLAVADLTFTAEPGETIALVGVTGAGKSTAMGLLHRAFDPQSGTVKIDGIDIRDMKLSALRHNIGVVFQEALLFDRSVAENLRVGDPNASDEQLMVAANRAQASSFIARHPDGLNMRVGERGRSLSGGERQRLSIARAMLKDPPILILDEATSALDTATEAQVQIALEEIMKNRTTFVIAHRLATIRNATRILVFDAGRLVQSGSFGELMAQGGAFAKLANAQVFALDAPPTPAGDPDV